MTVFDPSVIVTSGCGALRLDMDFMPIVRQIQDSPDVDLHETRLDTSPEGWQFSDILGGRPLFMEKAPSC